MSEYILCEPGKISIGCGNEHNAIGPGDVPEFLPCCGQPPSL